MFSFGFTKGFCLIGPISTLFGIWMVRIGVKVGLHVSLQIALVAFWLGVALSPLGFLPSGFLIYGFSHALYF